MGLSVLRLSSTGIGRRGYVVEVQVAPPVVWPFLEKATECPCRRFPEFARCTAVQLDGCLSSSGGVGRCFPVGHRSYNPENEKNLFMDGTPFFEEKALSTRERKKIMEGGPCLAWKKTLEGAGGELTHCVHASTYFAVDFDCPVGTPVIAVADGVVAAVKDSEDCGGIDCSFLFRWNQVFNTQALCFLGIL